MSESSAIRMNSPRQNLHKTTNSRDLQNPKTTDVMAERNKQTTEREMLEAYGCSKLESTRPRIQPAKKKASTKHI